MKVYFVVRESVFSRKRMTTNLTWWVKKYNIQTHHEVLHRFPNSIIPPDLCGGFFLMIRDQQDRGSDQAIV